ncbi:hypothetical protein BGX27_005691 [Mortierella sp. AM989]|nr:hypothetical protein BGX27_005691 [Mortierella sp. AM989]
MTSKGNNSRSQRRSSAELGQVQASFDGTKEQERTALLGNQRGASQHSGHNGDGDSLPNGIGTGNNQPVKRSLSGGTRRAIITLLTSICTPLLLILAAVLVNKIGSAPMLKDGGNAMDAAIASCLCIGTVNMFAAGIGGGGFMIIRLPNGTVEVIDFRETAPAGAHPSMFKKNPILAQKGGLSIAVPGEIRGLELAHKRHGKLPWERLFAPSVKMARERWAVGPELAKRLQWIKREALANTLEAIGREGADTFYVGFIAQSMVDHIQANGGILAMKDMKSYEALTRKALVGYYQGRKIYTSPAPTSGPVLINILNILEHYDLGRFKENANMEAHRLVEAMKFGYAQMTELGDPDFTNLETKIQNMVSKDMARLICADISDAQTYGVEYYNPHWGPVNNHGTAHISTLDQEDMAVALTSSVNRAFGSKLLDPKTGIILNGVMDDFSIPGKSNTFGLQPSPYNFPEPGKRPLSSCVPTIMERDGQFELALGGSGGSKIVTAVLQTIVNIYNHGYNVMEAVEAPRMHHQLMPNEVEVESSYSSSDVRYLSSRGHNVIMSGILAAQVQAVIRATDRLIYATSDSRKHGVAAGY